jgi:hypothetical protein
MDGVALARLRGRRQSLIVSTNVEEDGRRWVHLSMASPDRLPEWRELVEAKEALLGEEWDAYQVIPRRSRYVNQHPHCLHLFACLDVPGGGVLPDFSRGGASL